MFFVYIPFAFGYIQSELNKVWRNQEVTDPVSPELMHPGAMRAIPATARPAPAPVANLPAGAVPAPGVVRDAAQPPAWRRRRLWPTGTRIPGTRPGCATGTAATGPATRRPEARPAPARESCAKLPEPMTHRLDSLALLLLLPLRGE